MKLPAGSIKNRAYLERQFLTHFLEVDAELNLHTLLTMKQQKGEALKDFFRQIMQSFSFELERHDPGDPGQYMLPQPPNTTPRIDGDCQMSHMEEALRTQPSSRRACCVTQSWRGKQVTQVRKTTQAQLGPFWQKGNNGRWRKCQLQLTANRGSSSKPALEDLLLKGWPGGVSCSDFWIKAISWSSQSPNNRRNREIWWPELLPILPDGRPSHYGLLCS